MKVLSSRNATDECIMKENASKFEPKATNFARGFYVKSPAKHFYDRI